MYSTAAQCHLVIFHFNDVKALTPKAGIDGRVRSHRQNPAVASRHQVAAEGDAFPVGHIEAANSIRIEPLEDVLLERVLTDEG